MNSGTKQIAVIGLGNISNRHRRNLKQLIPDCRIFAVSSSGRLPATLPEQADQVLENVQQLQGFSLDLALVASPAPFHYEHAQALLDLNVPILVEKPLTADIDDAQRFIDACIQNEKDISVGYCLRFLPTLASVKALIESKELGRITTVMVDVGQYLPGWRPTKDYKNSVSANPDLGGGVLLELSHELDYLMYLFGPLEVNFARLSQSSELQLAVEEIADVMLNTESGTSILLHLDFLQYQPKRTVSIIGERGRLDWDLIANNLRWYVGNSDVQQVDFPNWQGNDMYLDMLRSAFGLQKDTNSVLPKCTTIKEATATVQLINQIKQEAQRK